MDYPHFIGGSYVSQSPLADQERTVNWYPERMEVPGASTRVALYPTPGVEVISAAAVSPGRAHFVETSTGREFAVIGSKFIEIASDGTQTVRGTVASDANPATISSNGAGGGELFITSGRNGYLFTLATNAFAAIVALANKVTMGDHLDGYFLALDAVTSTVYLSDLLDGATWDPTQFFQRSIAPDPWVSMKVANRLIWLFGVQSSEAWFDAGTSPLPFEPHPSGLIQYGAAAPFSPEVVNGQIFFVGATANGQGAVLKLGGFTPEPVSNFPLELALNGYSTIADGIGDTYDDLGHTFYLLTFPIAKASWAFDADLNTWHERGTWISEDNQFVAWRPLFHAFAFGEHRMLDLDGPSVYRMNSTLTTDVDTRPIRRVRRAPALVFENQRLFYPALELDMEVGLATISTPGIFNDPIYAGLVAGYNEEEAVGTRADITAAWDLAAVGAPGQAAGEIGFAATFDGTNYLHVLSGAGTALDFGGADSDMWISTWVYVTVDTADQYAIVSKFSFGLGYNLTYSTIGGAAHFGFSWSGAQVLLYPTTFALNTWYNLQAWRDKAAGTINLQLDGGTISSAADAAGVGNAYDFAIGANYTGGAFGKFLKGRSDLTYIWNRMPSVDERARMYNYGAGTELSIAGLAASQTRGPQVMMRQSNDGGKTWSGERIASAGKVGEYMTRVRWLRCGSGRKRVFEISVTDASQWRLLNAYLPGFSLPGQQKQSA